MFALSDLGSPDIGRGKKMKPTDWRGPQTEVGFPSPQRKVNTKKEFFFFSKSGGRRTIAILLRAKDKKTETRGTPKSFKPALKTVQSLLAPWKKRNSPVEPRQKNKISNFGTFFRYTQILLPLSLSIWKGIKARKRHLYSWTILLDIFDILNVLYIYNRSKEPMYSHFTMWSMLLFHAFLSASIRLTLSCLELSY